MAMADEAQQKIDAYLNRIRGRLRGLRAEERREILEELRSHLLEKAAAGGTTGAAVDAALESLGVPEQLAREYVTDELLARAEVSRSPLRILDSLFRWASLSIAGFFVLLGSITGYFLGVVFLLVGALKPFHPETAGCGLLGMPRETCLSRCTWGLATRLLVAANCWAGGSCRLDYWQAASW